MMPSEVMALVTRFLGPREDPPGWSPPGTFEGACKECGADIVVELVVLEEPGKIKVRMGHEDPLCAPFAAAYENVSE